MLCQTCMDLEILSEFFLIGKREKNKGQSYCRRFLYSQMTFLVPKGLKRERKRANERVQERDRVRRRERERERERERKYIKRHGE